jgi:hypothetical protein
MASNVPKQNKKSIKKVLPVEGLWEISAPMGASKGDAKKGPFHRVYRATLSKSYDMHSSSRIAFSILLQNIFWANRGKTLCILVFGNKRFGARVARGRSVRANQKSTTWVDTHPLGGGSLRRH